MTLQTVRLVFFSGTGGVKRIAAAFEQAFINRGLTVIWHDLDRSRMNQRKLQPGAEAAPADLTLLLFPLHAFDAPDPVYDWINQSRFESQTFAVISASGGGEAWPNTGCRNKCIRLLEEKGARVVYERMLCLPSNWVFAVSDDVAAWLLKAIPRKAGLIVDDLAAGKTRRTAGKMSPARAFVTRLEKSGARQFPQEISVDQNCSGCGLCAAHCPVENIALENRRPVFHDHCVMCFRCIYACPSHAMHSSNFMVLKTGYDLNAVEKRLQSADLQPIEQCCKGWLWAGIREYLLNDEK